MQASQFAQFAGASMVSQLVCDSWQREDSQLETETRYSAFTVFSFARKEHLFACMSSPAEGDEPDVSLISRCTVAHASLPADGRGSLRHHLQCETLKQARLPQTLGARVAVATIPVAPACMSMKCLDPWVGVSQSVS